MANFLVNRKFFLRPQLSINSTLISRCLNCSHVGARMTRGLFGAWSSDLRAAIVTGADHGYFCLMLELLRSLAHSPGDVSYDLCVLDFGLEREEKAEVVALGARIMQPTWWFDAPDQLRLQRYLGYAARPMIPSYFPGYDTYIWLDADISVQDGRFTSTFIEAAQHGDLAVVEEADPSYRIELYALKWHLGNGFRCFGLADGLKFGLARAINTGAFALRADAPHWSVWQERYRSAVLCANRANLDQHSLMATLCLDGLPARYLDSRYNWICTRSQPLWDDDREVFCRPYAPFDPISVLHLAGRQKTGLWDIKTLNGDVKQMVLTYANPEPPFAETQAIAS